MITWLRLAATLSVLPQGFSWTQSDPAAPSPGFQVRFRGKSDSAPPSPEPPEAPRPSPEEAPAALDQLEALRQGNEAAFRSLYRAHTPAMTRLARLYVRSQASAEEAVQEAWMGVLRGLSRFEGRSSLKTWIYRILVNQSKKLALKEGRTLPFSALTPETMDGDSGLSPELFDTTGHWKSTPKRWEESSPEKLAEDAETRAFILEALEDLPPKERAVLRLREIQLWTAAEVCQVLEISEVYQRVLLHRGRSKLRLRLKDHFEGELPC